MSFESNVKAVARTPSRGGLRRRLSSGTRRFAPRAGSVVLSPSRLPSDTSSSLCSLRALRPSVHDQQGVRPLRDSGRHLLQSAGPTDFGRRDVLVLRPTFVPPPYKRLSASRTRVGAEVLNVSTLKPFPDEIVLEAAARCGCIVTAEEHGRTGGLYSATVEAIAGRVLAPVVSIAMNDCFGQSGSWRNLLRHYGLDATGIERGVERALELRGRKETLP